MELTEKEQSAIIAIAKNGLSGMGGVEPKDLHDDNFSWFDIADMMKFANFSKHQAAGLISALSDKGLVGKDGDWYLTDAGIDVAQSLLFA